MELSLSATIVILIIAAILFISFYMISIYNKIIFMQNEVNKKFEPIDISIKKYISIFEELKKVVDDNVLLEELSSVCSKLSVDNDCNDKITTIKDVDVIFNKVFDIYKNNKKVSSLKKEYGFYHDKILYAKDIYNKKVTLYNDMLMRFPNIIITILFDINKLNVYDGE